MSTEPIHSIILNRLSHGTRHKPIQRDDLCLRTGLSDRKVRIAISELRSNGEPVISLTSGYYLASSKEELLHFVNRERKRALTILKQVSMFDKTLKTVTEQLELSGL